MRRLKDEQGAVLVIVVLMMVVLVGMAALVVDAGAMYEERRELQNGADAAALAVAEDCARGLPCTVAAATDTAAELGDANADDGTSNTVIDTDAFDPAGSVTVDTSTRRTDGTTAISFVFAPVLDVIGGEDVDGKTISASATAVWGYASSLRTLPLTISECEFQAATGGTNFESPPWDMAKEETLMFHDGASKATCGAVAGMDADADGKLPAGFGWLVPEDDCDVTTTVVDNAGGTEDDWAIKDPGNNPECQAVDLSGYLGSVMQVPVFADFCKNNAGECPDFANGDKYRIQRYAAFYLTGYDLGGKTYERFDPKTRTAAPDCGTKKNDDLCITGFFTTSVGSSGEIGGPNGGVLIVKLTD
jgi:hypothetical protein